MGRGHLHTLVLAKHLRMTASAPDFSGDRADFGRPPIPTEGAHPRPASVADDDFLSTRIATWRASSKKQAAAVYGQWLKWLSDEGRLSEEDPACRLTGQNVKDFAKAQLSRGLGRQVERHR